ncbi:MAG: type II secretion system F family protein [Thermodesulfobacteriota bacterium]|nr:type II secretion system F family protein [Thermodesulfobacteriota bacterium]
MPVYQWVGKSSTGKEQKGEMEATDASIVRSRLLRMRITPKRVKKKPKDLFENVAFLQPKVRSKDVIVFARQFSTMIDAGLPLIQCLDILQAQQTNKTFKKIIRDIRESVEGGATLSESFKKYPKQFNDLFVHMVAAGEAGGILDTIMGRLASYMEKIDRLKAKIKGAMSYPAVTFIIAMVVLGIILIFVIPTFQEMFSTLGGELPLPTKITINLSNLIREQFFILLGAFILFIIAFVWFYRTEKGRLMVDSFLLRLPVFGVLIRKAAIAKFTRTMGTMLSSGVSILDSLDIVAKTAGNKKVEKAVYKIRTSIVAGQSMADPMAESGVFPPMVSQMTAVGESTGALDAMLGKIADFYDDEVDQAVESLTTLIEPIMIVFLGVVIGGIVISMYLPIFKMASLI